MFNLKFKMINILKSKEILTRKIFTQHLSNPHHNSASFDSEFSHREIRIHCNLWKNWKPFWSHNFWENRKIQDCQNHVWTRIRMPRLSLRIHLSNPHFRIFLTESRWFQWKIWSCVLDWPVSRFDADKWPWFDLNRVCPAFFWKKYVPLSVPILTIRVNSRFDLLWRANTIILHKNKERPFPPYVLTCSRTLNSSTFKRIYLV